MESFLPVCTLFDQPDIPNESAASLDLNSIHNFEYLKYNQSGVKLLEKFCSKSLDTITPKKWNERENIRGGLCLLRWLQPSHRRAPSLFRLNS